MCEFLALIIFLSLINKASVCHCLRVDSHFLFYLKFVPDQDSPPLECGLSGNFYLEGFEEVVVETTLWTNRAYVLSHCGNARQRQYVVVSQERVGGRAPYVQQEAQQDLVVCVLRACF